MGLDEEIPFEGIGYWLGFASFDGFIWKRVMGRGMNEVTEIVDGCNGPAAITKQVHRRKEHLAGSLGSLFGISSTNIFFFPTLYIQENPNVIKAEIFPESLLSYGETAMLCVPSTGSRVEAKLSRETLRLGGVLFRTY